MIIPLFNQITLLFYTFRKNNSTVPKVFETITVRRQGWSVQFVVQRNISSTTLRTKNIITVSTSLLCE
jgi:hypothetical protein